MLHSALVKAPLEIGMDRDPSVFLYVPPLRQTYANDFWPVNAGSPTLMTTWMKAPVHMPRTIQLRFVISSPKQAECTFCYFNSKTTCHTVRRKQGTNKTNPFPWQLDI